MFKKVFIIGNGFDLNLGWNTSYRDFVSSEAWPLKDKLPTCPMASFLKKKTEIERWYDLENILKEYASKNITQDKADQRDEVFFNQLKWSLTKFLKQEEQKDVDKDSLAVEVLKAVVDNGYFDSIYTFNYTDLYNIAEKASIHTRFDYEPVHGSVGNDSIILGVDDHSELREGYSYLRKVFSEHYTSHQIRYALQECDEVVFFGHSLGDTDYTYFGDFFKAQSQCASRNESKTITIFTKDNHSRIQILEQLRKMNDGQTERLQNDNDFKLIMTDEPNAVLLNEFFSHLKRDSKATYNRNLDRIADMML